MHLTATTRSGATVDSWHSFNANSSQADQWIRATAPFALKKHRRTRLPSPLGALRVSGGLLEFLWDADHQTLGEVLDEAARRVTSYLDKTTSCDSPARIH